jgi:hypothetical protein
MAVKDRRGIVEPLFFVEREGRTQRERERERERGRGRREAVLSGEGEKRRASRSERNAALVAEKKKTQG